MQFPPHKKCSVLKETPITYSSGAQPVSFGKQRQDSLIDQLKTVLNLATEAGCYDAADFIKRVCRDNLKESCIECGGAGKISYWNSPTGYFSQICPSCGGMGKV